MTIANATISLEKATEHGLSEEEYGNILEILGREPSLTELGIFSSMWSEHCSYKSSKKWLKTLPTEGPQVIQGPGENAGVVDIGDGQAAVFKIESHNHPSFIRLSRRGDRRQRHPAGCLHHGRWRWQLSTPCASVIPPTPRHGIWSPA